MSVGPHPEYGGGLFPVGNQCFSRRGVDAVPLECHTGGGLTVLRNDTVMNTTELRQPSHPIEPLFVQRWSSRAFSREPMPMHDVLRVLEAARWAPSAYNAQPWRFSASVRGDAHWERTLSVLVPANRSWASDAGALVGVFSDRSATSHHFDAGAAWAHLALQATSMGYAAHAMAGFDADAARELLAVPEGFDIEIFVALGRRVSPEGLPEALREREVPSQRRVLVVGEGRFPL